MQKGFLAAHEVGCARLQDSHDAKGEPRVEMLLDGRGGIHLQPFQHGLMRKDGEAHPRQLHWWHGLSVHSGELVRRESRTRGGDAGTIGEQHRLDREHLVHPVGRVVGRRGHVSGRMD